VLFQQGALYSALSGFDNIALPLRELHAFDADFIRDIVMVKLGTVGIDSPALDLRCPRTCPAA